MAAPAQPTLLDTAARLHRALQAGQARARARGRRILVSLTEPLPARDPLLAFAHAGEQYRGRRCYWERPAGGAAEALALAGLGQASAIAVSGPDRFAAAATAWDDLLDGGLIQPPEGLPGAGPLLMGGFSFDPLRARTRPWQAFPDGLLILPRLTLAAAAGGSLLTLNALLSPDSDPEAEARALLRARARLLAVPEAALEPGAAPGPRSARHWGVDGAGLQDGMSAGDWQALVARTAREIREGRFAKVVLAREARLPLPAARGTGAQAAAALAHLRAGAAPGTPTFLFAVARSDQTADDSLAGSLAPEAIFLGASPERLLRLVEDRVEVACLAGSIRRGADAEGDRRLGQTLLASAKDRTEHAIVARMLREALTPLCRELEMPEAPELLRLPTVQHLHTPIVGRLLAGGGRRAGAMLDLLERLHPTPAVGGYPRGEALTAIREREGLDRGWYAAPVGWLDHRGRGEFAVAIRSALLREPEPLSREALLFAGCGIMGDSDPRAEYEESRLKLRPMLAALQA